MIKLSILTTITNPDIRQDKWKEALQCYCDFADEVVVVNGGAPISVGFLFQHPKIKIIDLEWPDEWRWIELPKHLNAGLKKCTGDWVIKLDIDQFIHERHFTEIRKKLAECPATCYVASMQKMSLLYNKKAYQKGSLDICVRNVPGIAYGRNIHLETDLCFPIKQTGADVFYDPLIKDSLYELPIGTGLSSYRTGVKYYNYDYFFKTKEFTKNEFWRFSRAYHRYYGVWKFGGNAEDAFNKFLSAMKSKYKQAPYTMELDEHPSYIKEAVAAITPDHFGHSAWGMI